MERLTIQGFDFDTNFVASNLQSWPIAQALKKLQAYEDAGLEPEEIKEVQAALGDIPFARFYEIMQAERNGKLAVLPCKPGEQLFVLSKKQYRVGNDYEQHCYDKDVCKLFEPYSYTWGGHPCDCCKTEYDGKCPVVVKPITVELFEVDENGVYPCYRVDFEGNSRITDWYENHENAETALTAKGELK